MSDIRSTVNVETHGQAIVALILGHVVVGQNKAGEFLLGQAVDRSPRQQGELIGTGQVVNAEQPGEETLVVFDSPYAARLHEHPEYNFSKKKNPNAQGKYLENAAIENRDNLTAIIQTEAGRTPQ